MSKKRMLADVLWEAANENLWCGVGPQLRDEYSCNALHHTVPDHHRNEPDFLDSLGCRWVAFENPAWEWLADADAETRQGVRYMWLLLAMHVAEDEGIEV
jgi:hypothetical protein